MWPAPLGEEGGGIAESDAETTSHQGDAMFHLELHQQRATELRRRVEQDRLVREALSARRAAAGRTPEAEPHTHGSRRHRFARAA